MTTKTRNTGVRGEEIATHHLESIGMTVLDRNWRSACGEIDIVALDGDTLVVVEVKARTSHRAGHPLEAVTEDKLTRLHLLALSYRREHPGVGRRLRVDVIGVTDTPERFVLEHLRSVTS